MTFHFLGFWSQVSSPLKKLQIFIAEVTKSSWASSSCLLMVIEVIKCPHAAFSSLHHLKELISLMRHRRLSAAHAADGISRETMRLFASSSHLWRWSNELTWVAERNHLSHVTVSIKQQSSWVRRQLSLISNHTTHLLAMVILKKLYIFFTLLAFILCCLKYLKQLKPLSVCLDVKYSLETNITLAELCLFSLAVFSTSSWGKRQVL